MIATIVSNSKMGYVVVEVDGSYYRVYRSEISGKVADTVGNRIPVVFTGDTDAWGVPVLSNKSA